MKSIIIIIILLTTINMCSSIDINYSKYKLKMYGLRFFVFKKRGAPKLLNSLKKFYIRCYDKSIVSIAQGMNDYNNNLTEDEKMIIETIISLCY